ncbi:late-transcription coactivator [Shewanella phage Thanatos-1]|nr:late-transcription coactivator [Shewanella phage Thanatos-1]QLA10606.1 late-transcription coactivator [Shewanella phage Thanatos-2]
MTESSISISNLLDKQNNGLEIERIVKQGELDYLEATTQWLEENSISVTDHSKYLPRTIVEKIMDEAIGTNRLRPSFSATKKSNSLDFLD